MMEQLDSELTEAERTDFLPEVLPWAACFFKSCFIFSWGDKKADWFSTSVKKVGAITQILKTATYYQSFAGNYRYTDPPAVVLMEKKIKGKQIKGRTERWKCSLAIRRNKEFKVNAPADSFSFCGHCRLDLQRNNPAVGQILYMRTDPHKAAGQTWRRSGIDDAPVGVLLLDRLLGLLQLCHVSVMLFPHILHVSHHELHCPAHSGLLSQTVKLHVEPHWPNEALRPHLLERTKVELGQRA